MNDFIKVAMPYAIAAIIGFVTSLIFYLPTRKSKKLAWSILNTNLVQDFSSRLEGLEIRYDGDKVSNLSTAKIAVWNAGTETIRKDDIVSVNPPRLVAKQGVMFHRASLNDYNNDDSHFEIGRPGELSTRPFTELPVNWHYLDPRKGAVIQIVHTGVSDQDVTLEGKIIGGKLVRKPAGVPPDAIPGPTILTRRIGKRRSMILFFLWNLVSVGGAVVASDQYMDLDRPTSPILFLLLVVLLVGTLGFVISLLRSNVPEDLDFYNR